MTLIRTRLQADGIGGKERKYKGITDPFRQILATDGVKGLYTGMGVNLIKSLPAITISFVVCDYLRRHLT